MIRIIRRSRGHVHVVGRSEGSLREEAAEGIGENIRQLRVPCQDLA